MKRLMFGILVVFGLAVSANAGEWDRLFRGENLEKYEDLKKRWEAVKNATENYQFYLSDIARYMEILEYADTKAGEIGFREAKKLAQKKYNVSFRFDEDIDKYEALIELEEGKLEERGLLNRYNNFKKEMAKCRLSGKICVEE